MRLEFGQWTHKNMAEQLKKSTHQITKQLMGLTYTFSLIILKAHIQTHLMAS